ncbi:uncharacterized protein N7511_007850 [Penicillium nucicola]|uniref:uncharacterized protein n=1 Tax=Penicillium nucicola TaxID=1850975 RepID=UPI002544D7E2|nr:uncharacterized protein N7511_007850 [Penicillium nucicola]KAJ5753697.1 hypothetical protein N7511_007850 [Penicillium nucicola]
MPSDSENPARSIFTKKPMLIKVGKDSRNYYAHEGVLDACPAFDIEFEFILDWTAFDEQTVECVLSFLYTGDYPVNLPALEKSQKTEDFAEDTEDELLEEPEDADAATEEDEPEEAVTVDEEEAKEEEEEEQEEEEEKEEEQSVQEPQSPASELAAPEIDAIHERSCQSEPTSAPTISNPQSEVGDDLISRPLTPIRECPGIRMPDNFTPTKRQEEPQENEVAEIYLHAKVYSFACHYDFTKLQEFTLNRLAQILDRLQRTQLTLFPYLADAIRLIYTSTEAGDSARYLLSQFVALEYLALSGEEMNKLVAEGGDFMVDVSEKLTRKIGSLSLEEKVEELIAKNLQLEFAAAARQEALKSLKEEVEGWESWNRQLAFAQRRKDWERYQIFTYEI